MKIEEVKERVEEIRSEKGDSEQAHWLEDILWGDVLVAISEGADNPEELAKACLETGKIDFDRWYA